MVEKEIPCPKCSGKTQSVGSVTVKHLLKDDIFNRFLESEYNICLEEDCPVVYFSHDKENVFTREDLKVEVWYKKDADPKYICYCSKVTQEQIIDAVAKVGARSFKEVVKITGAMRDCRCEENNPLGKCCSPEIIKTIKKALRR